MKNSQKEIIAAGNIVEKDGKILMVQEKRADFSGIWNIPMGRIGQGEDIITCAKREGKEETGYELEPSYLIGKYSFSLPPKHKVICFIFKSEIIGGQLIIPEDMLDVKFLSLEEIRKLDKKSLVASFVKDIIQDYQIGKKISLSEINLNAN